MEDIFEKKLAAKKLRWKPVAAENPRMDLRSCLQEGGSVYSCGRSGWFSGSMVLRGENW